jgi:hypothetical protein
MAAYNGGLITEEAKMLNLARLSLYVELPLPGGRILEQAIEAGAGPGVPAHLRAAAAGLDRRAGIRPRRAGHRPAGAADRRRRPAGPQGAPG